ncbi:hypothetical protein D5E81_24615 [Vibrio parahaemolyticus]|nr:hypothetical protein D5E81_24615 [Vibrio parahaemolyticus]
MKLDNQELHELLVQKGVTHFHHANSLATAVTFIEEGGLLSRGDVEKEDLIQTNQSSDDDDKDFDVWDDVLLMLSISMVISLVKIYMDQYSSNLT